MDDDQTALNIAAGEEASEVESPPTEPTATEDVETSPADSEATAEVETGETKTETEDSPRKGAQARIRELASEKNQYKEKAKSLEQKLAELTGSVEPSVPQVPYTPQVEAGSEISPDQYKQDVLKTAEAMVNLRIKQSEAVNRINSEASQVITQFPQLDPESDQFDPELSDSVTEATEAYVRANPYTASPKEFVSKMMKPYQRAVTKRVGQETANLAKQVAESATRPTSITTKGGKSDTEKSIAELEAELGINQY